MVHFIVGISGVSVAEVMKNFLFSSSAKPRCGSHAAVLGGQEGVSAHRGARRWLCTVQDGGQHRGVDFVLLCRERPGRRKSKIYCAAKSVADKLQKDQDRPIQKEEISSALKRL